MVKDEIQQRLFEMQDMKYRDFSAGLMPTVSKDKVIGVRTPAVRKLAKELSCRADIHEFLADLPHTYYEENNLHAFIIEQIKEYDKCVAAVNAFLPYIDNWSTCDMMKPKIFSKNTEKLLVQIEEWLAADSTYTIRFGIEMLMSFYLDENFKDEYLEMVATVSKCRDEYYVNMMIAWYFATALAKQYEAALPYIEGQRLDVWTHNKTIQKARESYRVGAAEKEYLKSLKRR